MIKGANTKPEIIVRKFLFNSGYRFRINNHRLPGKPDIVLPKYKVIFFINGCFWHGHEGCEYFQIPKTRTKWWRDKILRTKERDSQTYIELENLGWKVHVIWECELKKKKMETLNGLLEFLK